MIATIRPRFDPPDPPPLVEAVIAVGPAVGGVVTLGWNVGGLVGQGVGVSEGGHVHCVGARVDDENEADAVVDDDDDADAGVGVLVVVVGALVAEAGVGDDVVGGALVVDTRDGGVVDVACDVEDTTTLVGCCEGALVGLAVEAEGATVDGGGLGPVGGDVGTTKAVGAIVGAMVGELEVGAEVGAPDDGA